MNDYQDVLEWAVVGSLTIASPVVF